MRTWRFLTLGLTVLLLSSVGGFITYLTLNFFIEPKPAAPENAVSIANTYIVFTTLIFVGFTVLLAMIGVVFAQQFSVNKQTHVQHLFNELENGLENNRDDIGIKLIDGALKSKDVQQHIQLKLEEKVQQAIDSIKKEATATASDSVQTSEAADLMRSKVAKTDIEASK